MSLFAKASKAIAGGDFSTAIAIYRQGISEHPQLARQYEFNIELVMKRARQAEGSRDEGPLQRPVIDLSDSSAGRVSLMNLQNGFAKQLRKIISAPLVEPRPLISILMTTFNVAEFVEAAVVSVLRQTYANLELVIVDDSSTDNTWEIIQRLKQADRRVVCKRLNTNLGTYFAKNYALQLSRGEVIFFQDGDDLSHSERINACMRLLDDHNTVAVRSSYCRVAFPAEYVVPVNGLMHKLGFITLGVRRRVFDEIGFFNCTNRASDEEFFQRLLRWSSMTGSRVRDLDLPLYISSLRENSLFSDMIANDPGSDGRIEQIVSPDRQQYVNAFKKKHAELDLDEFRNFFRFPVTRDLIPVAARLTSLANPTLPVIVSLCSIPERVDSLQRTLKSLANQVDEVYVYLDRYDSVPDFVSRCHAKVHITRSQDVGRLRDNGKFLPFSHIERESYFFTADDDIVYPPDYVACLVRKIEFYGRQAVVGVHGVLIPEMAKEYFSGYRKVHLFKLALERDALVNNLGTGTVAFYTGLLGTLSLDDFPSVGMADLHFSVYCKNNGIPMISVARSANWLEETKTNNASLYDEFKGQDPIQAKTIAENQPWGYAAVESAVRAACDRASGNVGTVRIRDLVPKLCSYLR